MIYIPSREENPALYAFWDTQPGFDDDPPIEPDAVTPSPEEARLRAQIRASAMAPTPYFLRNQQIAATIRQIALGQAPVSSLAALTDAGDGNRDAPSSGNSEAANQATTQNDATELSGTGPGALAPNGATADVAGGGSATAAPDKLPPFRLPPRPGYPGTNKDSPTVSDLAWLSGERDDPNNMAAINSYGSAIFGQPDQKDRVAEALRRGLVIAEDGAGPGHADDPLNLSRAAELLGSAMNDPDHGAEFRIMHDVVAAADQRMTALGKDAEAGLATDFGREFVRITANVNPLMNALDTALALRDGEITPAEAATRLIPSDEAAGDIERLAERAGGVLAKQEAGRTAETIVAANARGLRLRYIGATPDKFSRTGSDVVARMRDQGLIQGEGPLLRGNPNSLKLVGKDGSLIHIDSNVDMAHTKDAVTWWNEEGRFHGAQAPQVRKFMLDPDNYELRPSSVNRSAGAKLRQTYMPPAAPDFNIPKR